MTGAAPVPLKHERISAILAREIESGQFEQGDRLPSEVTLARRFGVSRTTVRAALAELTDDGLIATRTGKGSFVLYDGQPLRPDLGWAHALAARGVVTGVRVLSLRVEPAALLDLDAPTAAGEVVVVERVRELAFGPPISFERAVVPAVGDLATLPERGLAGSLTAELRAAGLVSHHGRQRARARRLTADEASVLGRRRGDWFLQVRRTSLDVRGELVEEVESLLDPDHFELQLSFGGER